MYYLLVVSAAILLAGDFSVNKIYQKKEGASLLSALRFNMVLGLFSALLFFLINGFRVSLTWYSCIMACLMNSLVVAYVILGFQILKRGSMAFYTLFLMTGGMTLPYIYGLFFLQEPLTVYRCLGLALILSGVILSHFKNTKADGKLILLCIAVFVLNGFVSIVSKAHQIAPDIIRVNDASFAMLGAACKCLMTAPMFLFLCRKQEKTAKKWISGQALFFTLISAVISGSSFLLQLFCASVLPASVLFPFLTGGSIVFSTFADHIFFHETITGKLWISTILCCVGALLFL